MKASSKRAGKAMPGTVAEIQNAKPAKSWARVISLRASKSRLLSHAFGRLLLIGLIASKPNIADKSFVSKLIDPSIACAS
jgi:hypothetical protein